VSETPSGCRVTQVDHTPPAPWSIRPDELPSPDPDASRTRLPDVGPLAAEIHVAPDGDDAGDGSPSQPFAGLTRARDAVRQLRTQGLDGPIAVTLAPGEYPVTAPLELTAVDSGTAAGPVIYRAAEPGRTVLYGGQRLTGFTPVTDPAILSRLPSEARGHVVQCDLKTQGISDFGELRVRGYGHRSPAPTLELMVDGQPQTVARWPNRGFVEARSLIDPGDPADLRPAVLEYEDPRHERWTQAKDPWLFGYFRYLWADTALPLGAIDAKNHTLTTGVPYEFGGDQGMSTAQGIIYYAFNLLEEIDEPGEYYIDRDTGVLYFYPPCDPDQATIDIGMLTTPMVTLDGASDVRLEGLTMDLGRDSGVVMRDCQHCVVCGCTVSRMAANGILIHGGEANGILSCDIHTIGRRATEVIGGDRETLTPGRHFIENCRIHGFGRIDRTYTPAIQLEGVGLRVAHNLMYDCPSSAMRIEGNDHLIEYNEVHSAVQESDDQGGMELYMNTTHRGVVFRYNKFHDLGKTGGETAVHGQAAIRLDDAISGLHLYGNLFIRCANGNFGAVQMNSGRDNVIENNMFVDCRQAISGGWNRSNNVWQWLRDGETPDNFYFNDLYLSRYPQLAGLQEEPGINHVWRNLFYQCGATASGNADFLDLRDNGSYADQDPGFVDASQGDYRLRADAPLLATGFMALPVEHMGLYADDLRPTWPVTETPQRMPDWRESG
jgi:hypothetical protein